MFLERGRRCPSTTPWLWTMLAQLLGNRVTYARSIEDCLKGKDVCVSLPHYGMSSNNWKCRFSAGHLKRGAIVLDCWRILRETTFDGLEYTGLGLEPSGVAGGAMFDLARI